MRCLSCGKEINQAEITFIESDDGLCSDCAKEEDYLEELKNYIDALDPDERDDILREFPHLAKD